MNTKIQKIDPTSFEANELSEAGAWIREGKLVAFPTETVYGLGANALDGEACKKIFEAKGRPQDNPLIVHVYNPEDCAKFAYVESSPLYEQLAKRFMPGPLTVILPKKSVIPDSVTVGLDTVALRCPAHPIARALLAAADTPIAAPSANLSGKPSPTAARHVIHDMMGRVDMILDGGDCEVGLESTVISLKGDTIHLLRPGYVTENDLREICENVLVSPAVLNALSSDVKPESPGMKYRHYAPNACVTMVRGTEKNVLAFFEQKLSEGNAVLCFDEDLAPLQNHPNAIAFGSQSDLLSQANGLFGALRKLDEMDVPCIYARFTAREGLGLAVSNRLLRACAFQEIVV